MKKVVASLESGAVYTGALLVFFYVMFFVCVLFGTALLVVSIYFYKLFSLGVVLFYLFAIGILAVIIINQRLINDIEIWKKDAVEVKAQSNSICGKNVYSGIIPLKAVKIQVKFQFNGRLITRESGFNDGKKQNDGFAKIFAKYADRKIDILYSPQYDKILILDEAKNMSNEKLIKKYFDFLKRKGFKRKELFRNGDSEITYSKKGMIINVSCELGVLYVPLTDNFADFSKNASDVVSVIIKHGYQADNLLYCDLFEKQIRMKLKWDIEKVKNQDIEQTLKIYSQFIMDNLSCIL